MKSDTPPPWLTSGLETVEPGELVTSAVQKARRNNAAKDVADLYIGNIFAVFLVLLAPFFKVFAASVTGAGTSGQTAQTPETESKS